MFFGRAVPTSLESILTAMPKKPNCFRVVVLVLLSLSSKRSRAKSATTWLAGVVEDNLLGEVLVLNLVIDVASQSQPCPGLLLRFPSSYALQSRAGSAAWNVIARNAMDLISLPCFNLPNLFEFTLTWQVKCVSCGMVGRPPTASPGIKTQVVELHFTRVVGEFRIHALAALWLAGVHLVVDLLLVAATKGAERLSIDGATHAIGLK